jgi:hypothetical protein
MNNMLPGSNNMASSVSLDLPAPLASILSLGTSAPNAPAQQSRGAGLSSGMTGPQTFAPSYEVGGMIGPGGMPEPMSAGLAPQGQMGQQGGMQMGQQGSMTPQMMEMQVNQFATQHPQELAQIKQSITQALQSGEMSQQELNMITQLAAVAAQNPEMYPYVRNFAIQQGIATEQDLPAQYDQGLVFVLMLATRAVQEDMGGQDMVQGGSPAMAGGQPIPSMAKGGMTPDSKKADGSVLINAHEGEYVIPKRVVEMKGKEFFDNLVEKYREA